MLATLVTVTISVILFLMFVLAVYVTYMSSTHGSLQKLGFVGPEYKRLWGTMFLDWDGKKDSFAKMINEFAEFKKHKVYATYHMRFPRLVVADLNIIKDIFGKHANQFSSRCSYFKVAAPPDSSLVSMDGEQWKRVRRGTSTLFSTNSLKTVSPLIEDKARDLVEVLKDKQESGEPVELKDLFSVFLLDSMTNSVFSLDINSFKDPSNEYLQNAKIVSKNFINSFSLVFFFPFLVTFHSLLFSLGLHLYGNKSGMHFVDMYKKAVEERRKGQGVQKSDYLQVALDQQQGKNLDTDGLDADDVKLMGSRRSRETLNDVERMGAVLALVFGGFDNGSTAVAFTLFVIANNPSVLKKVQDEIDEKLNGEFPNYENTLRLTYLEMCINEVHRLYPVGIFHERLCVETCEIQGVTFPKDVAITIPTYAIHHDPDLWHEPEKFDPERFSPENRASRHPCAFLPFGGGPRNCVGIRLAQLQIRLALATVLQAVTPALCDKTVYPIPLQPYRMLPINGMWIKFERRKTNVA